MKLKNLPYYLVGSIFGVSLLAGLSSISSASILQGFQGGTGLGTATSTQVGQCLQVSSSTPFLTWSVGTCGSGGGFTTSTLAGLTATSWNLILSTSTSQTSITTSSPNNIYLPAAAYLTVTNAASTYQPISSSTINTMNGPFTIQAGINVTISTSTNPSTLVINSSAQSGQLIYYMWNSLSNVAGYKQLEDTPTSTTNTFTSLNVATGTIVAEYITDPGVPGITSMPAGNHVFHIHASRTGTIATSLAGQFWEVSATGTDIMEMGQSDWCPNLTVADTECDVVFSSANPHFLSSVNSRIAIKVLVRSAGTPDISIYTGGNDDTHIEFPGNLVTINNFVPYTGAIKDVNLGNHTIQLSSTTQPVPTGQNLFLSNVLTQGIPRLDAPSVYNLYGCDVLNRDLCQIVQNNTGGNLTIGQVIYVGQNLNPTALLAQANSTSTAGAFGVVATSSVVNGGYFYAMNKGILTGIDTSSYATSTLFYLSPTVAGGVVTSRPTYPNLVVKIAKVLVSSTNGALEVSITPAVLGQETGTISPTFNIGGSNAITTSTISSNAITGLVGGTGISVSSSTGVGTITNIGVQTLTAGSNITLTSATGTPIISVTSTPSFSSITATSVSSTNAFHSIATTTTLCLTGDTCRTTWPTGGSGAVKQILFLVSTSSVQVSNAASAEATSSWRLAITPTSAASNLILRAHFSINTTNNEIQTTSFYDITNATSTGVGQWDASRRMSTTAFRGSNGLDINDVTDVVMEAIIPAVNTTARTYTIYTSAETTATRYLNVSNLSNGAGWTTPFTFTITEF